MQLLSEKMQFPGFSPQGSAEAQARWGGKTKHLQIAHCLRNRSS